MCDDCSSIKNPKRLAIEGEVLVAHRFRNGSIGLVSLSDFSRWRSAVAAAPVAAGSSTSTQPATGFWKSISDLSREFLKYYGFIDPDRRSSEAEPGPVVGIPYEALLRVFDIAEFLQRRYHLGSFEDALFTEIAPQADLHRGALCFGNGVTIPLQLLYEGQKIKVLRRFWAESIEPAPWPIHVKA
jgi:hypothetical protein